MRLVVDGDYLVYSSGFAGEHNFYLVTEHDGSLHPFADKQAALDCVGDPMYKGDGHIWQRQEVEPIENVLHSCKLQLTKMRDRVAERCKIDKDEVTTEVYLTGTANYRERWATISPYKGNRDPRHKPVYMREVRDYLVKQWGAHVVHWMEADDMVSIVQTQDRDNVVVASIDKDLLQVPGLHYVPKKGFKQVSERMALLYLYRQILTGDPTDNIAGCYRVAGVTGTRLIKTAAEGVPLEELEQTLWPVILTQYERSIEKYGEERCGYSDPEKAALETAALVYMLREMPADPAYPPRWSPKL